MKFIEAVCNIGRSGILSDLPHRWSNEVLKTPLCLSYTRAGSLPHLTYDTLQLLNLESNFMLQTLPTIAELKDAVKLHGKGIGKFVGLPEYPFHISMQDPASKTPSGYNVKKGVSVWMSSGRKTITVDEFMEIQKIFRPISYQALCDSDSPFGCSQKRLNKSVDNSLRFLDECLEQHGNAEELKDVAIFGTVQGGYDMFLRRKSAREIASRLVDGFVIDGFHQNGLEALDLDFTLVKPLLEEVINCLPNDKPRILHGALRPAAILEAVRCGVDIFDSSYPYLAAEVGHALIFSIDAMNSDISPKFLESCCKPPAILNLNNPTYGDDFSPVVRKCECYTCTNFTRAYIHHLFVTSELLGKVLLMLHNMHHFSAFFRCIRISIENNTFEELEHTINNCGKPDFSNADLTSMAER